MAGRLPRPHRGEPLPLDLLNTEWADAGAPVDFLATPAGAADFLAEHGVTVGADELGRATRALVTARATIRALLEGEPETEAEAAAAAIAGVLRHARVATATIDGLPAWSLTGDTEPWSVPVRAVADVVNLLRSSGDRIHRCAHPDCVLWFLDTSRRGGRRWHSMATCGNRAKAQRHYARHRDDG